MIRNLHFSLIVFGLTLISVLGVIKDNSAACCSVILGRKCVSPGCSKTEEGWRGGSLPLPWTSSMISTSLPESSSSSASSSSSSSSSSELEVESSSLSFKLTTAATTDKRTKLCVNMWVYYCHKSLRNTVIVHDVVSHSGNLCQLDQRMWQKQQSFGQWRLGQLQQQLTPPLHSQPVWHCEKPSIWWITIATFEHNFPLTNKHLQTCWRTPGFVIHCGFLSGSEEVTGCCQTDVSAQSLSDLQINVEQSAAVSTAGGCSCSNYSDTH